LVSGAAQVGAGRKTLFLVFFDQQERVDEQQQHFVGFAAALVVGCLEVRGAAQARGFNGSLWWPRS
jgi:hypothetical protein